MAIILITGGTGLIGKALGKALLEKGHQVIILTRNTGKTSSDGAGASYAKWDIEKQEIDKEAISTADHIIHLAGAGIGDKRWTRKRKQEIIASRVNSSSFIVNCLKTIPNKIKTVVCASAIGWYGPDPDTGSSFKETDPPATDFLGDTCRQWEESITPVIALGKRLVILRTGIVLSGEGGALKEFVRPLKFGLAAILGKGRQITSWIHIDDLVNMYISAIGENKMKAVYNAVAPEPVSNKKLVLTLARSRKKFFIPVHVPSFILKLVLGEMSTEVLKSATVSSQKIRDTGFDFSYPLIEKALAGIN
ncbi:MAG: TIGR01777 family oxidoreductase [Chitinophagaceae bacterium]